MVRGVIAVTAVALAALTGCGGGSTTATNISSGRATAAAASAATRIPAGTIAAVRDPDTTVTVRAEPADGGQVKIKLAGRTRFGSPTRTPLVLPVDDERSGWLHVTLPTRPNGGSGWVDARLFQLRQVNDTIRVDLSDREITITVGGETHTGPVTVGAPDTPTPTTGDRPAYVTDNLAMKQRGAYGTVALGVSLHSTVLNEFDGGDGQIGIHGTNDQASVGKPISHGCIRVASGLEPVLARVPVGTPVVIVP